MTCNGISWGRFPATFPLSFDIPPNCSDPRRELVHRRKQFLLDHGPLYTVDLPDILDDFESIRSGADEHIFFGFTQDCRYLISYTRRPSHMERQILGNEAVHIWRFNPAPKSTSIVRSVTLWPEYRAVMSDVVLSIGQFPGDNRRLIVTGKWTEMELLEDGGEGDARGMKVALAVISLPDSYDSVIEFHSTPAWASPDVVFHVKDVLYPDETVVIPAHSLLIYRLSFPEDSAHDYPPFSKDPYNFVASERAAIMKHYLFAENGTVICKVEENDDFRDGMPDSFCAPAGHSRSSGSSLCFASVRMDSFLDSVTKESAAEKNMIAAFSKDSRMSLEHFSLTRNFVVMRCCVLIQGISLDRNRRGQQCFLLTRTRVALSWLTGRVIKNLPLSVEEINPDRICEGIDFQNSDDLERRRGNLCGVHSMDNIDVLECEKSLDCLITPDNAIKVLRSGDLSDF